MITPIALCPPAATGYRHANVLDFSLRAGLPAMDDLGEARPPLRIRVRGAMRWFGVGLMRALNNPRVRQAGSWPRYTRDGLL